MGLPHLLERAIHHSAHAILLSYAKEAIRRAQIDVQYKSLLTMGINQSELEKSI